MNNLGDRLREERTRVKLTQEQLAAKAGIKRLTQGKYEKNESAPDSNYLQVLLDEGIDIFYVLSGKRMSDSKHIIYERPENALMAVIEVQSELGLSFSGDQLKQLIVDVHREQMDKERLHEYVINCFKIANQPLPKRETDAE